MNFSLVLHQVLHQMCVCMCVSVCLSVYINTHQYILQDYYAYNIAGKFGSEKIWLVYSFQAFGKRSLTSE